MFNQNYSYPMPTPIGTLYPMDWQLEPYLKMTDEQLEQEIKKPFIDPVAYAVYRKRRHL